jgi:hypothetical protein
MAKRKRTSTNNHLQNITQKIKDRTSVKIRGALSCSGRAPVPTQHVTPLALLLNDTNITWYGNHVGHQFT